MVERQRGRVAEGMLVRSLDGEKLGKVVACQSSGFVVEKGFLFPKDLSVSYDHIRTIANGEIILTMSQAEIADTTGRPIAAARVATTAPLTDVKLASALKESELGTETAGRPIANGEPRAATTFAEFGKAAEIIVPLAEEEVVTHKHVERVGEVHVRKETVIEERQITVPVMREVLRVERTAVNHEVRAGDKPFEKQAFDIPMSEEHVTIEKRVVVREEVRIGKEIQQAEETASTTVRHEHAEVETLGAIRSATDQVPLRKTG